MTSLQMWSIYCEVSYIILEQSILYKTRIICI